MMESWEVEIVTLNAVAHCREFCLIPEDKPHLYGQQKVFASLGWGVAGGISGFLIDFFSNGTLKEKNYMPVFLTSFVILMANTFWSYSMKVCKL